MAQRRQHLRRLWPLVNSDRAAMAQNQNPNDLWRSKRLRSDKRITPCEVPIVLVVIVSLLTRDDIGLPFHHVCRFVHSFATTTGHWSGKVACSSFSSCFALKGNSRRSRARARGSRLLSAQAANTKQRGMGISLGFPHLTRERESTTVNE